VTNDHAVWPEYITQAVAARWAARLGQRSTLSTQGPIRLRHACQVTVAAQRAAAACQPASRLV